MDGKGKRRAVRQMKGQLPFWPDRGMSACGRTRPDGEPVLSTLLGHSMFYKAVIANVKHVVVPLR
jgi:hypothetical protein